MFHYFLIRPAGQFGRAVGNHQTELPPLSRRATTLICLWWCFYQPPVSSQLPSEAIFLTLLFILLVVFLLRYFLTHLFVFVSNDMSVPFCLSCILVNCVHSLPNSLFRFPRFLLPVFFYFTVPVSCLYLCFFDHVFLCQKHIDRWFIYNK